MLTRAVYMLAASVLAAATWEQTYDAGADERGVGVAVMPDDGLLVLGGSMDSLGDGGVWLVRTNDSGAVVWDRTFREPGASIVLRGSAVGPDRVLFVGDRKSSRQDHDVYALCVDTSGNRLWSYISGIPDVDEIANAAARMPDGGWAVGGYTLESGQYDFKLLSLGPSGSPRWSVTFGTDEPEFGHAVAALPGGVLLAGTRYLPRSRYSDAHLAMVSDRGVVQWERSYGGEEWDEARALVQLPDGGFAFAGFSSSFSVGMDCYLQQTDSTGQGTWRRTFGLDGSDRSYTMTVTQDGGTVLAGESYVGGGRDVDLYVVRFGPTGTLRWERWFGGSGRDAASAAASLPDGGFVLVGETRQDSARGTDIYVVRTDSWGTASVAESRARETPSPGLWPNPFVVRVNLPASGPGFVRSADGRVVRELAAGSSFWDGRDAAGDRVRDGVYFVDSGQRVFRVIKVGSRP